ncbi:hypothetical protein [Roseicyclus sp.]|uniref:hypothetical protein n=1 Tax=Roseicyclus sp. TaxID=1914329 RepID=UPI003F9F10EA
MRHALSACLAFALTLPVVAQTLDTRPGDALIPVADLDARLRGRELVYFDGGVSHFYNDGRYTYAYDGGAGGYAYGYFEIEAESTVCVRFITGAARCDAMVENAGRLILITAAGDRFPIREVRDAGPDPQPD